MRRILVPVDGSEPALHALSFAAARAREAKGEVHALHVEPPPHYPEARAYAMREDIAKIHQEARQRILNEATDLLRGEGVPHTAHMAEGEIATTVVRFAEAQKFDEIVMGTRGMALGPVLLGSVASRVVHLARVPVTLVK